MFTPPVSQRTYGDQQLADRIEELRLLGAHHSVLPDGLRSDNNGPPIHSSLNDFFFPSDADGHDVRRLAVSSVPADEYTREIVRTSFRNRQYLESLPYAPVPGLETSMFTFHTVRPVVSEHVTTQTMRSGGGVASTDYHVTLPVAHVADSTLTPLPSLL